MNCYKVSYAAVWVSGPDGPDQRRNVKEGTLSVLAESPGGAGQIASAHVPGSPHEVQINHVQEVAKNVIVAASEVPA